jgi:cobalt/nickel transport system permease protein
VAGVGTHGLYVDVASPVHRLAPPAKLAATFLFVIAVVTTPREAMPAFAVHASVVAVVVLLARLPIRFVLRRLVFEVPFVAFAFFLPIIGRGPRTDVVGLSLSVEGLWAAWNILAKGTLGVAASVVLAGTTTMPALLRGLERLRLPRTFTSIAGFMVRYLDVIAGEMQRMKIARLSRGYDPRWIWQTRAWAASAGTLFIRSYERGERVHLAMISRGYTGTMPTLFDRAPSRREWLAASCVPAVAAIVSASAWVLR